MATDTGRGTTPRYQACRGVASGEACPRPANPREPLIKEGTRARTDYRPDATPRHAWSSARLYAWLEKCPKLVAAAKTASEPASGRDLMGDHPQFRLSAWFFVAGYGGLRRSKNGSAAIRRIRNFRCTERLR